MIRVSIGVVAALLLMVPAPEAAAQHPQVREGFWIGFGFGYGSLGASDCEACEREGGFAGVFRLGGKLSDRWLLGFESNAWIEEEFETTFTVGTSTATAYFYPNPAGGLHLKGGIGLGHVDIEDGGDDTGTGLVLGIAYDARVGRNISIVPVASWFVADFDNGSLNVLQVGVGVTFH
jgi:hypothetical protein